MRKLVTIAMAVLGCSMATAMASSPQDRTKIHIYSATDTWAIAPLIELFQRQHPSIDIDYVEFDTTPLFKTVVENRNNAAFEADIVISSAMDLQVKLVNMGLAYSFVSSHRDENPKWAQWRDELYGFTYEPVAVVYNVKAFTGRTLPKTHSDLASSLRDDSAFFNGRIGTYDVRGSGVAYLFAAQDAIQGYQTFRLTESFGRAKAKVFCRTSDMVDHVATGDLVLSYNVIASYALAAARHEPRIGVHFLSDYTLVMSRSAFIPKTSQHKNEAMEFIEFLLSQDGQSSIAQKSSLIPIRPLARHGIAAFKDLDDGHSSFIPIKLGTGLLAYLDTLKKRNFLQDWEAAMALPATPPGARPSCDAMPTAPGR